MILTLNYGDLQNIRKKYISEKIQDKEKIYTYIQSYKDTLTNMYKNNLVKGMSREEYEIELYEFANSMLSNTDISKREVEKTFNGKPIIINNKTIKLWLN